MIDYARLDRSIEFYSNSAYKFQRIESPWTVTQDISNITKPIDKEDWEIVGKNKVLVASGEQSFLYLYLKNFLPKGKFQTITPCFRNEPFDSTHTKYFLKNELIITDSVDTFTLQNIVEYCKEFFEKELETKLDIIKTEIGFDIEYNGYELGSYGIRSCDFLDWIYATGCAEPRMSTIKKIIKKTK